MKYIPILDEDEVQTLLYNIFEERDIEHDREDYWNKVGYIGINQITFYSKRPVEIAINYVPVSVSHIILFPMDKIEVYDNSNRVFEIEINDIIDIREVE